MHGGGVMTMSDEEWKEKLNTDRANFSRARMGWTQRIAPLAEPYYAEQWPDGSVHSLEEEGFSNDWGAELLLDLNGVDTLVETGEGFTVMLAQRFLRSREGRHDGFTLRYHSGAKEAEYGRLMAAYKSGRGFVPGVFAWGVVNSEETGFERFMLIESRPLLRALTEGSITFKGPFQNRDDTSFVVITQPVLRRAGAVLNEWDHTTNDQPDYHTDASTWGL